MKYWVTCILVFASIFFFALNAKAQKDGSGPLITGEFTKIPATEFLSRLQKQTGYTFYYDEIQLDSITINLSAAKMPLMKVLELAFANTSIHYSIDQQNRVFISKGATVRTELPPEFYGEVDKKKQVTEANVEDKVDEPGKKQPVATLENKLYIVGDPSQKNNSANVTLVGYIHDAATGEPISGASIFLENSKTGVTADQFGYYSITVPKGRHILNIQSLGMKDTRRQVMVYTAGKMNIDLQSQVVTLKTVVVSSDKINPIRNLQMGVQRIDNKTIKQIPAILGEADVLRVIMMMPGVQSVGEASTGLNVRGGSADQNLILFNDATIFNPSHFFGMFSSFNPEIVKSAELYKSTIPAKYGGRLSSVLEISTKEGNKKNLEGSAGIGILTSRFNIEGPLAKDKSSFIIAGRTTYANWLLNFLPDQYKNSRASFYDVDLNINQEIDKKNNLYITGYMSDDHFNLNNDTVYHYGNKNISVKWKHVFNNNLYSITTFGYDRYQYDISSDKIAINAYKLSFDINQAYFRTHFNYYINAKHTMEFGVNGLYYKLHPGTYQPDGKASLIVPVTMHAEQAFETAVYASDKYSISPDLSVEAGVRYSFYNYLGAQNVNVYAAGVPKTTGSMVSTVAYADGKTINTYGGAEFRISMRYALQEDLSIKAGYNTQRQYIHVLSNTAAIAPTDIWKLSDPNIKPQSGGQYSLGLFKNFASNTIETSVEVYYKEMKDYLDYKSGAVLVLNPHIETDVIETKGKAYGIEFLLKKSTGKFNGWLSYTYSRTFLQMNDSSQGSPINHGEYYSSSYDKPNDVTFVGNYKVSHRFSVSFNATYSTGRPITLPIGKYFFGGSERTLYSDRNAYRIPDYIRADFSINIDGNHKVHQKTHNSWTIGVYNLTGRKNPYSVYYVSENGVVNGYKLSVFGNPIPYINFNIRF